MLIVVAAADSHVTLHSSVTGLDNVVATIANSCQQHLANSFSAFGDRLSCCET